MLLKSKLLKRMQERNLKHLLIHTDHYDSTLPCVTSTLCVMENSEQVPEDEGLQQELG